MRHLTSRYLSECCRVAQHPVPCYRPAWLSCPQADASEAYKLQAWYVSDASAKLNTTRAAALQHLDSVPRERLLPPLKRFPRSSSLARASLDHEEIREWRYKDNLSGPCIFPRLRPSGWVAETVVDATTHSPPFGSVSDVDPYLSALPHPKRKQQCEEMAFQVTPQSGLQVQIVLYLS